MISKGVTAREELRFSIDKFLAKGKGVSHNCRIRVSESWVSSGYLLVQSRKNWRMKG